MGDLLLDVDVMDLQASFAYAEGVKEMSDDIRDRFSIGNGPRISGREDLRIGGCVPLVILILQNWLCCVAGQMVCSWV